MIHDVPTTILNSRPAPTPDRMILIAFVFHLFIGKQFNDA